MENLKKSKTNPPTDAELVQKTKNHDNDSLKELVARHEAIYYKIKHQFASGQGQDSFMTSLDLNISLIFYNVCLKFDESRNCKFTTLLTNEIRWMFLNAWKKYKSSRLNFESLSEEQEVEENLVFNDTTEIEQIGQKILQNFREFLSGCQDERVLKIFEMRYAAGPKATPWRVISKKIGLTTPGCIYIHNRQIENFAKANKILC